MRKIEYLILLILTVCLCNYGKAVNNPAVTNPSVTNPAARARAATTPPTSRVYRSPNPIDSSGNLVVTGNVRAGKSFQGSLPYRSTSDFGVSGSTSTGTLDSFIRDSAGIEDIGRYRGGLKPFFSPTQTSTTTRAGSSAVFTPPTPGTGRFYSDQFVPRSADVPGSASYYDYGLDYVRGREKTMKIYGQQEPILSDAEKYLLGSKKITANLQTNPASEEFDLDAAKKLLSQELKDQTFVKPGDEKPQQQLTQQPLEPLAPPLPETQFDPAKLTAKKIQKPSTSEKMDVYEQMLMQIDELAEQYVLDKTKIPQERLYEKPEEEQPKTDKPSPDTLISDYAKARLLIGEHKSFASYSKDMFNTAMRQGEEYLKQGKYYMASERFAMAAVYKPDDPLAYAAKSQALLGAGEYLSSALFLARTINMFNEYVIFDIDIESRFPDKDYLAIRLKELDDWIESSKLPQLQFLAAYYNLQLGKLKEAAEYIESAHENLPDHAPVTILKKAIENRLQQQQ
ncbi:MAG: hypothetical protein ISS77_04060 [Phycisphaerae bacterium]|nr:hypothetical protein [Phycisphaerae bacterium]